MYAYLCLGLDIMYKKLKDICFYWEHEEVSLIVEPLDKCVNSQESVVEYVSAMQCI